MQRQARHTSTFEEVVGSQKNNLFTDKWISRGLCGFPATSSLPTTVCSCLHGTVLKAWSLEPGTWVWTPASSLSSYSCENDTMGVGCCGRRAVSAGSCHCTVGTSIRPNHRWWNQKLAKWPKRKSDQNELVYLFLDARLFVYLSSISFPTYGLHWPQSFEV